MDTIELKCKKCGSTKLKQITRDTKLCEECGAQIISEGIVEFDKEVEEKQAEMKFKPIDWKEIEKFYYSPVGRILYSTSTSTI